MNGRKMKMNEYEFTLKFDVPKNTDLEVLSTQLYDNGCDDSSIGIGTPGSIALYFIRESKSASEAVLSAIKNVKNVIADAKLTEAAPDLVGATDIAEIMGVKRQAVQKIAASKDSNFPLPVYVAKCKNGISLWHLSSVLEWLMENRDFHDDLLLDLSSTTMTINLNSKPTNYRADLETEIKALVA